MAQFDVHRVRGSASREFQFVVVMQADTLQGLLGVLVAPMHVEGGQTLLKKLHVIVDFQGARYVVAPEQMISLPRAMLGQRVGSLAIQRADFIDAIDFIFSGY